MECLQVISLLFVAVTQDKLSDGALENWLEKTHEKEKLNLDDFLDATIMALWDARYLEMMKCKKCGTGRHNYEKNKCPAFGKLCYKCKEIGHFRKCCSKY